MFTSLSKKITEKLKDYGIVAESDNALYEYGLRQLFTTILNILTMLLIGLAMKMVISAILYTFAYIPIRIYAGGYHASTPKKCWAFSAVMLVIVLWLLKMTPAVYFLPLAALSLISSIGIAVLSPVEDQHKPLDEKEHQIYRFRVRIALMIEIFIAFALRFILPLEFAWCSLMVMLILGKFKIKRSKEKGGFE